MIILYLVSPLFVMVLGMLGFRLGKSIRMGAYLHNAKISKSLDASFNTPLNFFNYEGNAAFSLFSVDICFSRSAFYGDVVITRVSGLS